MLMVLGGCGPEPMMETGDEAGSSTGVVMGSSSDGAESSSDESTGGPAPTRRGTSSGDDGSSTGSDESSTGEACEDPGACLDAMSPLGASCDESCLAAGWMCEGAEAFDGACGEIGEGMPVGCSTTIDELGEGCLYLRCECGHG